ncbi:MULTISPECIES: hypothetical protein [unclassified Duganella]|uniref:hypothetical protein n=1 Tax=unclassified Duganella TaxID=2636909 RepID=UPI0006F99321|nr:MULTISPECIES: hypothetical protein [unclassified Duganella]KQV56401.1 hypothetical protein ASD07_27195 [Duganella sp. Root336D2]KRB96470.1 hypothetical protein ASE26_25800 [Duganella sp. Root198D2]
MSIHRSCLSFAILLLALSAPAGADEPLDLPVKIVTCSKSGAFCAESDPKTNRTSVRRQDSSTVLWTVDGWYRWMFVSNDGRSFVVARDGMNLVPADADLKFEVLRIYDRGNLVRSVILGDLYKHRSQLRTAISHLAWARSVAINASNQLDVELIDGRHQKFPMK